MQDIHVIYLTITQQLDGTGDVWQEHPTFDRKAALRIAADEWNHLTRSEQARRRVYVGVYTVVVPAGDTRTAGQIFDDMLADDTWPIDHDVLELPKEGEADA